MRKVTICKVKEVRKPGKKDDWYEHTVYRMQPGTAWRIDPYGQHEVVEVSEDLCKKSEGWCSMQFDGRNVITFEVDDKQYAQPTVEDSRATEDRLGKKRKIRKRKEQAPRREAPGVAPPAAGAPEPVKREKKIKVRQPRGLLKRVLELRG